MPVFRSVLKIAATTALMLMLFGCSAEPPAAAGTVTTAEVLLNKGQQKSRMCMGCHGPQGISRVASYPSLAGQSEDYLTEQLQAFRSGERENPMMSSIAKSLGDEDIKALAFYYAQQAGQAHAELSD
jgi:cytochrome c553